MDALITELSVSLLPEDHPDFESYRVCVRWHGKGRYGVHRGGAVLSFSGKWEQEPIPSAQTSRWIATHWWPYTEARNKAYEVAHTITLNGVSVLDILARSRSAS